jgi:hypothetical protein
MAVSSIVAESAGTSPIHKPGRFVDDRNATLGPQIDIRHHGPEAALRLRHIISADASMNGIRVSRPVKSATRSTSVSWTDP